MRWFSRCATTILLLVGLTSMGRAAEAQEGWFSAAPLPAPRQEIYAATRDGLIYTAGGLSEEAQTVLDDFVVYDPEADKWRELPPLPEARHHITLSVADGRLYAVGGFTGGFPDWKPMATVFSYDFSTELWKTVRPLPIARGEHVSAVVDGKIFVIGGRIGGTPSAATFDEHIDTRRMEVFDPRSGVWSQGADAPTARNSAASAVIDGKIYVVGGRQFSEQTEGVRVNINVAALEVYDPDLGQWSTKAPMPKAAGGVSAAAANGKLYVFGGEQWEPNQEVISNVWAYDPATDEWSEIPNMMTPRHGTAAASIRDRIFVFGGAVSVGANAVAANESIETR